MAALTRHFSCSESPDHTPARACTSRQQAGRSTAATAASLSLRLNNGHSAAFHQSGQGSRMLSAPPPPTAVLERPSVHTADRPLEQHGTNKAPPDLSGHWTKDKRASRMDAFKQQLDLLGLGGVAKAAAVKLLSGLSLEHTEQGLKATFKVDRVPFFRSVEQYSFHKDLEMPRRDNREGSQVATLTRQPDGLLVDMRLLGPLEGSILERYRLVEPNTMHVESVTRVGAREQDGLQVYHRAR